MYYYIKKLTPGKLIRRSTSPATLHHNSDLVAHFPISSKSKTLSVCDIKKVSNIYMYIYC